MDILFNRDFLEDLFYKMILIRSVELGISREYIKSEIRTPVHLCVGQEATPVGVSANLMAGDKILSGHRSHGHYLACGGNLKSMVAEIYGKSTGCSNGKGGSQHLIDTSVGFLGSAPILASTISIGVGIAWALKQDGCGSVCVVYFGDAAVEEGAFHESLSFASLHKLPIIFVCENNFYSTHSPLSVRQPNRPITDLAIAHAVPSKALDGNDVLAITKASQQAIKLARAGGGPTFLVCETYRWLEHVGPNSDEDLGYRSKTEIDYWKKQDPIDRLRKVILNLDRNWASKEVMIESEINSLVEDAFNFAKSSPLPIPSELLIDVYGND